MSILTANLKHLYQKRSFWFVGLFLGAVAVGILGAINAAIKDNKQGVFCAPVLWMLFVGAFIATLSIDVLTKPFSYGLPSHRNIPRKFLFSVGLPLSFLWSLSFLFFPDLNFAKTTLACLSAFSIFTIFYWLGVWLVFKFRNWSVIIPLIPLVTLGDKPLNISILIVHAIVASPLLMILLGGLVNYLAWSYWGRADLSRQYCGKLWMGAFDGWNKEKMSKFRQAKLVEKDKKKPGSFRISSNVERFFIFRIDRAETGSLQQYIWGALYKTFGLMISQQRHDWWRFFMLMIPILCFLCYMPGGGKNIIFLMPGIMVVHMSLGVHSSLIISNGRRQRFWSALTLAVTTGIFVTVVVVLLAIATHLLEGIMPQLTVKGHDFAFKSLNMNFTLIPFLMIPVTLTMGLIFYKKPMLTIVLAIVLFQIFFAMSIVSKLTIMNWRVQIGLMQIIIMLLISWTLFIMTLRYISMRCCLVKQS